MDIKDISDILSDKNIRPSFQRIKIYEYLVNNNFHPTVDDIYINLVKEIPTLSKTTIYNTLDLFVDKKLVSKILLGDKESRYDASDDFHGHFKCNKCNKLYDIDLDIPIEKNKDLIGFDTHEMQIHLKGICKECNKNMKNSG